MFDSLVRASEAMRLARPSFVPALAGCPECRTVFQIAAPSLGACPDCGVGHTVLDEAAVRMLTTSLPAAA